MAVAPVSITDLQSFQNATRDPYQISGVYFFAELDALITSAYLVSKDFFDRPHHYTSTGGPGGASLGPILARLRAEYGSQETVPSTDQRSQIYSVLFGTLHNGGQQQSDFGRLKGGLVAAATAFAERTFDSGLDLLRENARKEHALFKSFLAGLHGDSVTWTGQVLADLAEKNAYQILRSPGISAVFGITTAPAPAWPYGDDPNGDRLIEEISRQLQPGTSTPHDLTRERVSQMQRCAVAGAEALTAILTPRASDTDAALTTLLRKVYTWASASAALKPPPIPTPTPALTRQV